MPSLIMVKNIKLMDKYKRGFTLIEILVVIAIIGILASVVLASLNSARNKGSDAAVKSDLNGLRGQAAIYYDDHSYSYTNVCADPKFVSALAAATTEVSAVATIGGLGDGECKDSASAYAVWINLKFASSSAWCVDFTGKSAQIPAQNSSSVNLTICP